MADRCAICGTARGLVFCARCEKEIANVLRCPGEFSPWAFRMWLRWAASRARQAERRRQKARTK